VFEDKEKPCEMNQKKQAEKKYNNEAKWLFIKSFKLMFLNSLQRKLALPYYSTLQTNAEL